VPELDDYDLVAGLRESRCPRSYVGDQFADSYY